MVVPWWWQVSTGVAGGPARSCALPSFPASPSQMHAVFLSYLHTHTSMLHVLQFASMKKMVKNQKYPYESRAIIDRYSLSPMWSMGYRNFFFAKYSTNADAHIRPHTHPYERTHAHPTPMNISRRLSQRVSLEIDKVTKAHRCRRKRRLPLKKIPPK